MDEEIGLPELKEIATWLDERCRTERTRLRNELAFIQGDRVRGGPLREDVATELKSRLLAIEEQLENIRNKCTASSFPKG
jgi:hypothetical protein